MRFKYSDTVTQLSGGKKITYNKVDSIVDQNKGPVPNALRHHYLMIHVLLWDEGFFCILTGYMAVESLPENNGVTRLQWARVQVFQKGPLFPVSMTSIETTFVSCSCYGTPTKSLIQHVRTFSVSSNLLCAD